MKQIKNPSLAHLLGPVVLCTLIALNGCDQQTFYRTDSGLTYQVWHRAPNGAAADSSGVLKAGSGATIKAILIERHGDSLYPDTAGQMPMYQQLIPGIVFPYTPGEALSGAMAGDSIVIVRSVAEMQKKGVLRKLPKGWHGSDEVVSTLLVERVFPFNPLHGDSILQADKLAEAKRLVAIAAQQTEPATKHWLAQQGLPGVPFDSVMYRVTVRAGTGQLIDTGMTVRIRYRISTTSGKVVDGNMDSVFKKPPVLETKLGLHIFNAQIEPALRWVPRGSHLRVFMPRSVQYPLSMVVKWGVARENLVWDIDVE